MSLWRSTPVLAARALAMALLVALSAPQPAHAEEESSNATTVEFLRAEEDRIDLFAPTAQVDAYLGLRRRLMALGSAEAQPVLARLVLKLDLANARAEAPDADYAMRLSYCRRAAAIGESYLDQGDPERALGWEKLCNGIEPENQYTSVLRNQANQWFLNQLNSRIVAADWLEARRILERWRGLLPDDRAADEGVAGYARARTKHLGADLRTEGADAVLVTVQEEESGYPGLAAWTDFRDEVAQSLQRPFDGAIAERRAEDASSALKEQIEIAERFGLSEELAPLEANRERLRELIKVLEPAALQRKYGHICHHVFRMELGSGTGPTSFDDFGESIEGSTSSPMASIAFKQRGEEPGAWQGGDLHLQNLSGSEDGSSASALVYSVNWLIGTRGEKWSAWTGVGATFAAIEYTGQSIAHTAQSSAYGNFRLGAEGALGESFSALLDCEFVSSTEFSRWRATLGVRYYATHSFAIGIQSLATGMTTSGDGDANDFEGNASLLNVAALVQF